MGNIPQIFRFLFGNIILAQTGNDAHRLSKVGYKLYRLREFFESKTNAVTIDINSKISKLTKIISQSSTVEGFYKQLHYYVIMYKRKNQTLRKSNKNSGI
ncbi:MAG: hypothetical protein CM1200mP23_5220 [Nitrososphaerota archaeon]|nr:MAG: hypothetical protein CM1200mP23_5220 [Nitrososphaerota archaeon]